MSAVSHPCSSHIPVSAALLRRMLEQALRSDAALDAFCIDYCPAVYRQFGNGMERTRKLNLLLSSTPPATLFEYLRCHASTVVEEELALPALPLPPAEAGLQRRVGRTIGIGSAVFGAVVIAVLVLGKQEPRDRAALPADAATVPYLSATMRHGSPLPFTSPWLTSEPTSALVFAMPSGVLLGQTPWTPAPTSVWTHVPTNGLQVCLHSAGFIPLLVRLEPGSDSLWSHPIHARLQPELRAARQSNLGQETCNVPTPIIK